MDEYCEAGRVSVRRQRRCLRPHHEPSRHRHHEPQVQRRLLNIVFARSFSIIFNSIYLFYREMSHPWFRVALVTLLALTDLIVYFYETGRMMGQRKKFMSSLLLKNLSWLDYFFRVQLSRGLYSLDSSQKWHHLFLYLHSKQRHYLYANATRST